MPLVKTPKKANAKERKNIRGENIGIEIAHGKSPRQAAAIAYAEERKTAGGEIDLSGKSCTIAEPIHCKYKTALGVALDVSKEAKLPIYGKLKQVSEKGYTSNQEADKLLGRWAHEVQTSKQTTADQKDWATAVLQEIKEN